MTDRILVINPNSTEAVTRGIDAAMADGFRGGDQKVSAAIPATGVVAQ